MGKYRVIAKHVEAVKWTGENLDEVYRFAGSNHMARISTNPEAVDRLEYFDIVNKDWFFVPADEWLVRDENGVVTLMDHDEFVSTYEPVSTHRGDNGDGAAVPPARQIPRQPEERVPMSKPRAT